ncbi:MAG: hypothetical protein AB8G17_01980 [Gammaproteobacteria bacterium]
MKLRISLIVLLIILGLIGWLSADQRVEQATGPRPLVADLPADETIDDPAIPEVEPQDKKGCLSEQQMEGSRAVMNEARRRDPIDTRGPDIEAFRGVEKADLEVFAESGNSAAMVVLATRIALEAQGKDPDTALDVLNEYGPIVWPPDRVEGEALAKIREAEHWFYEAALHGRVLALQRYGSLRWLSVGGPVELGWIDRDTYATLDGHTQITLIPGNFYGAMVYDLHPGLREGLLGFLADIMPDRPLAQELRQSVMNAFLEERAARGLRAAVVPPSLLSWEGVMSELCASDLARLMRSAFEDD